MPGGGSRLEDPRAFSFACEGSAITKCHRVGSKPWEATVEGVSLAAHHQACTRLVRADFCGDGTSHTVDGQWVNLFDAAGVQVDTEAWSLEAEWDEDGARCFSSWNRADGNVTCATPREAPDCGLTSHFTTGTLLMSELPPAP